MTNPGHTGFQLCARGLHFHMFDRPCLAAYNDSKLIARSIINCATGGSGYARDEKEMFSSIYAGHGQSGRALAFCHGGQGRTLCELRRWQFIFRKSAPAHKEFFLFWSVDGRRYDYAFNDYFHAEQRYRKSGSKIVSKSISAFEAAPEKMDAAYARVKDERNAFFQHFHVQLLIAALLLAAAEFLLYSVLEAVDTAMFAFLASVFLAAAPYYLVSVLMLRNARKAYVRRRA